MNVEDEVQPPADNNFPVEIIVNPETNDLQLHSNVEERKKKFYMYLKICRPHLYLYCFVFFYIFAGAAYFYHHESAFEIESNNQKLLEFVEIQNDFYNKTRTLNDSNVEYFTKIQQELFNNLVSQIYHLKNIQYFTTKNLLNETIKSDEEIIWSFSNSIFFATTILTTIEYTNKLAPETFYGKIGVIIYGIVGIPILWIAVYDIAKFLSDIVFWGYQRYHGWKTKMFYKINRIQISKKESDDNESKTEYDDDGSKMEYDDDGGYRIITSMEAYCLIFILYIAINGLLLKFWKGWTFFECIYICFNTMATIRFGKEIPSKNDDTFLLMLFIIFGTAFIVQCYDLYYVYYRMAFLFVRDKFLNFFTFVPNVLVKSFDDQIKITANPPPPNIENIEDIDVNGEENKKIKLKTKILKWLKILLRLLFLYCLFFSYILLGAAYFKYHESAFEVELKTRELSKFTESRNNFFQKTQSSRTFNEDDFAEAQQELFKDLVFIKNLKNIQYFTTKNLLNETIKNDEELIWSFSNSIFFATTILTTIGYTNKLAPETFYGKIGVIVFAFFGIPLLLMTVKDIERIISSFMLKVYLKCKKMKEAIHYKIYGIEPAAVDPDDDYPEVPPLSYLFIFIVFLVINGYILKLWKGWTFFESIYICFNIMSTIGFVNQMPSENDNICFIIIYLIFGLAIFHMCFEYSICWLKKKFGNISRFKKRLRKAITKETNDYYPFEIVEIKYINLFPQWFLNVILFVLKYF